jgi:hypothetical protein
VSNHISVPPVTIGTHRLWISLWTRLGQDEDNTGDPGGNWHASGGENRTVHSPSPASHCPHTGLVATERRPGLHGSRLSPGSTVPTTTTNFFFTTTPNASRWVAGTRPRSGFSGATRSRLEVCTSSRPRARHRYPPGRRPLTLTARRNTGRAVDQYLTGGSFR